MRWLLELLGLVKRVEPFEPPTAKQKKYAKVLGIVVRPDMSKGDVSALIGDAERSKPSLAEDRERVVRRGRERRYGKDALEAEERWSRFSEDVGFMLAIYRRGKGVVVDVLHVNGVEIDEKGRVVLGLDVPRVIKDKLIGPYLNWEEGLFLPLEKLLHSEALHKEFHSEGMEAYRRVVEKGLVIAKGL